MKLRGTRRTIRAVSIHDLSALRYLNEAAVPNVNALALADLDWFRTHAPYFRVIDGPAGPVAFLIALIAGLPYDSPNYRWFSRHRDRFAYIDRIVVAASARGQGLGQALYGDLEEFARPFATILACEVNLRPANPDSLRFHERFGFVEAGRQETEGGAKEVVLLEKRLGDASHPETS